MLAALKHQPPAEHAAQVMFENGTRILRIPAPVTQRSVHGKVPIFFERGALKQWEAARYLGICRKTLWKLTELGKVRKTSYGTYPLAELDRHLKSELK